MTNPVHECNPPVDGASPVLGQVWHCICGDAWRVYKDVLTVPPIGENLNWYRAGWLTRAFYRKGREVYA